MTHIVRSFASASDPPVEWYAGRLAASPPRGAASSIPVEEIEERLRRHFLRRAWELIECSRLIDDPMTRIRAERLAAEFWQHAQTGGGK